MARASTAELDILSQTAVIIYPILLPDRLELLVNVPVVISTTAGELNRQLAEAMSQQGPRLIDAQLPTALS